MADRRTPNAARAHRPGGPARGTVSLARALSKLGLCSRSQGEQAIREGRVRVNGRVIADAARRVVPETDAISLDGGEDAPPPRVYIMLNKPRGLVTTRHDPQGRDTVYRCLENAALPFLGPVGRLDQASEGLLLFSNDTQWANAITAPASHVRKTYHVQIDQPPTEALLESLRDGVTTESGELLGATRLEVLRTGDRRGWLLIELDEGKNRQIRRMLQPFGVEVLRLVRVSIGSLVLGALAKGAWRHLTAAEVTVLRSGADGLRARPSTRYRGAAPRRTETSGDE